LSNDSTPDLSIFSSSDGSSDEKCADHDTAVANWGDRVPITQKTFAAWLSGRRGPASNEDKHGVLVSSTVKSDNRIEHACADGWRVRIGSGKERGYHG